MGRINIAASAVRALVAISTVAAHAVGSPSVIPAATSSFMTRGSAQAKEVSFPADAQLCDKHEFDPLAVPRRDVDLNRWKRLYGLDKMSKSQTQEADNAWKMDPGRPRHAIESHPTRGYPTPESQLKSCQCIAERNARELAEHVGRFDFPGSTKWPSYDGTIYLPKRSHTSQDTITHVDEFPEIGPLQMKPFGETARYAEEADIAGNPEQDNNVDTGDATQVAAMTATERRRNRKAKRNKKQETDDVDDESGLITHDSAVKAEESRVSNGISSTHALAGEVAEVTADDISVTGGINNFDQVPDDPAEADECVPEQSDEDTLVFTETELGDGIIDDEDLQSALGLEVPGAASSASPKNKRERRKHFEERLRVRKELVDLHKARVARDLEEENGCTELPNPDVGDAILGSGSARHLLAEKYTEVSPEHIKDTDQVMRLATANGPKDCDKEFTYWNRDAELSSTALILPDTPSVLSLGLLVIIMGWHFEWPAGSYSPFAVKPNGYIVWFVVRDFVTFFAKAEDYAAVVAQASPIVAAAKREPVQVPPLEDRLQVRA